MKIENIVCSGSFNQELDLNRLSECDSRIEYGKNRYPGAYIRFDNHFATIYRTGKYIMQGIKSIDEINQFFSSIKDILSPFCDTSLFSYPSISNIVCSSDVGHTIDLTRLLMKFNYDDLDVTYEPEAFPGLILKTEKVTYNVFSSGKFLMLGCTDPSLITQLEDNFMKKVDGYN